MPQPSPHGPGSGPDATAALVRLAKEGSQDAWEELYERYRDRLVDAIRARIPSFARKSFDAEDVLQSSFLSVYEHLDSFEDKGEDSFRRWITHIVFNRFRDKVRENLRDEVIRPLDTAALEANAAPGAPLDEVTRADAERVARKKLDALSPDDQELVRLRFEEGLSWALIGERLGCDRATARKRFDRALRLLGSEARAD